MHTINFFEQNGYMRDMEETLRSISENRNSVALHSANQIKHLKSLLGGDVSEWLKDGETVVDRLKREREDLGKTILWVAELKKQKSLLREVLQQLKENISTNEGKREYYRLNDLIDKTLEQTKNDTISTM